MISPRTAQLVSMFTFIVSIAEGGKNCNQSVKQCCDGLSSYLIFLRLFCLLRVSKDTGHLKIAIFSRKEEKTLSVRFD